MQYETTFLTVKEQVADLNGHAENADAGHVLAQAIQRSARVALVSSFGAESIVLLHMASRIDRNLPVLFLDTQMLFQETLAYQTRVATRLGLTDVRRIHPDPLDLFANDTDGLLHQSNRDACCALRKTEPLRHALSDFDTWITGRKRFQSSTRAKLDFFEVDAEGRIKANPLAHWQPSDVQDYINVHNLPLHPLRAKGFASIGCAPCTSPVKDGEDARAGRWRDSDRTECGIHFANGKTLRQTASEGWPT